MRVETMIATLPLMRPMGVGEIIDTAITLYRRNFLTLVSIAAIISGPLLIMQIIAAVFAFPLDVTSLNRRASAGSFDASMLVYFAVYGVAAMVGFFASVFQQGAIISVVSESFQSVSIGVRQAYGRAWRRGWALLGAFILSGILYFALFGALFFPLLGLTLAPAFIASSTSGAALSTAGALAGIASICLCLGFIPALILSAFVYTRWVFWPQAIILETKGVRSGLGRSWRLVRGSFWRVLGILSLVTLFIWLITVTPSYAVSMTSLLFPSPLISIVLNSAVVTVISILASPIRDAILTVVYFDLRIRKEGYDLELRAKQMAQGAVA
jgi:hypothetical protein